MLIQSATGADLNKGGIPRSLLIFCTNVARNFCSDKKIKRARVALSYAWDRAPVAPEKVASLSDLRLCEGLR